jgi:hypothetical protein
VPPCLLHIVHSAHMLARYPRSTAQHEAGSCSVSSTVQGLRSVYPRWEAVQQPRIHGL